MIPTSEFFHRLTSLSRLIWLATLFTANPASADLHLAIQVSDPSAFRNYFWIDRRFGGLLSDFIELPDGTYNIEVFGPPGNEPFPNDGMFYALTVGVAVVESRPEIGSVSFNSYCWSEGVRSQVKEWPRPTIIRDAQPSAAFQLLISKPIVTARDAPCTPPHPPSMANWANVGVLRLIATSVPTGAEVWVGGERVGKTNSTISVPYRDKKEEIDVVFRIPGYVNCKWRLKGPFENEALLNCIPTPP